MFPPIPPWQGLHPLIVHFPIALLIVAPVLVVMGCVIPKHGRGCSFAALAVMALGTAAAYVAVATGEAGARLVERTPEISAVLARHADLAEKTRLAFTVLTLIYGAILAAPALLKRPLARKVEIPLHGAFVILYAAALLLLVNTAHRGGLLVHEYGVRAMLVAAKPAAPAPDAGQSSASEAPQGRD